jgi:hypothetical protein
LTLWCIGVVLSSLFVIGVPVTWVLHGRRPLTEACWVKAPFLGMAAIVLALQNLFYLDVPVERSAPFLWGAALFGWLWLWLSKQLPATMARCPRLLLTALLLVYLVQGLGLLVVGARYYVGRGGWDECNYDLMAEFVAKQRFSTPLSDVGNHPGLGWIILGLAKDRLGQSMLQAFFAVSCGTTAKTTFEPTILLCPALVVLAVHALCRRFRLSDRSALVAGTLAGLLPSLALLHQEAFLSQALVTPLLLYLPAGLCELCERPSADRLAGLLLLFAAAASIYAEFWLILLGLLALILLSAAPRHPQAWRLIGAGVLLGLSTFLLNPGFTPYLLVIQQRVSSPVMAGIYPWASRVEGLGRLWLGELAAPASGLDPSVTGALGLGATALACLGLLVACRNRLLAARLSHDARQRSGARALAVGVLALALGPAVILARDPQLSYQSYKLLLSVSPLFAVGLSAACWRLVPVRPAPTPLLVLGGALLLAGGATTQMALQTTQPVCNPNLQARCLGFRLLDPDVRELQDLLGRLHGCNLLDAASNDDSYFTGWFVYFSRNNNLWLTWPEVLGVEYNPELKSHWEPLGYSTVDLDNAAGAVPDDARRYPRNWLLLTSNKTDLAGLSVADVPLLWSNRTFAIHLLGAGPWVVPTRLHAPSGVGIGADRPFFWIGREDIQLEILANQPGTLRLTGQFIPGPHLARTPGGRLRLQTTACYSSEVKLQPSPEPQSLELPVPAGKSVLTLTALDPPAPEYLPAEGPPPLLWLWGVQGLRLQLVPCPDHDGRSQAESRRPEASEWAGPAKKSP